MLFYVDSPGGDALASDLIWREVERVSARKPVVVLMGNAAASGGYYVSAAASHVVARRGTLTGSIGVLAIRPAALGLYEKLGINPVALERGRAGLLDPSRRPSPDEMRVIEGQIGRIYTEFKDRVARGRGWSSSTSKAWQEEGYGPVPRRWISGWSTRQVVSGRRLARPGSLVA